MKEENPRRRRHMSTDLSDSEESQDEVRHLADSDSDLGLPVGEKTPNDEDAPCVHCEGKFCDDVGVRYGLCVLCAPCGHTTFAQVLKNMNACVTYGSRLVRHLKR
ncbi:hypothetical protein PR048_015750 [Dryococelus australis]|uniref:Uncharacterized protein n=1 Tax=Dryococelus australis TaxID=614101 RepID=A0ABQ9HHZ7_9NEOP|nr:hypothetical protein PR048_015750 [Dryococelus australis]